MSVLFVLFSLVFIPLLYLFLGLQVIALGDFLRSGMEEELKLCLDASRYLEFPQFLKLILFLSLLSLVFFLLELLFPSKGKPRWKCRGMTLEEKGRLSHMAGVYEAKKGTVRIEFDAKGKLKGDGSIRGLADLLFDGVKRRYNALVGLAKLSDVHRLNTLEEWTIEGRKVHRRAGPPILTKKRAVWVDAKDSHSMICGTTRSGKGYFIVSILLQIIRMCHESAIIMDVKGEHYRTHAKSFMDEGYEVIRVDFIEPKRSKRWNPFGIIIRKYRQAHKEYLKLLEKDEYRKIMTDISANALVLRVLKNRKEDEKILEQIEELERENGMLKERLPKPDYSEAHELIADIAMRLCHEEDARDPFWSSSATSILEGYISFLLEEKTVDESGKEHFLPDEMINMKSVKMLHELGKRRLQPSKYDGCQSVLEYCLKHYRRTTDMSFMKLNEYVSAPENTRGSISAVFADKIKYFLTNEDILRMTSVSDFDLKQLGEKRTAIFIAVHDEKGTYHELPSILISQIYEELIKSARSQKSLRLPIPVHVVWDEFANGAKWDNIVNALTAGLSRGVRFYLVIQDLAQLATRYGREKASTIRSNCQNLYYLLSGDSSTLEEISKLCGTKIVWNANRQEKESVPVLSTDALQKLSFGEAVIIRQRKNPFKTRLRPFDRYGFKVKESEETPERELPDPPVFDIGKAMENRRKAQVKPRGDAADTRKAEKTVLKQKELPVREISERKEKGNVLNINAK